MAMMKIRCVVERVTYQNPENGYSVLKVRVKGYDELVTVVGNLLDVPFPKKQTQKKLRKPNEAKEINQPAQSGKQNAREPATPKQSGDANDYKKPQCTQKCRPEPELGKQNAAGE